MSNVIVKTVAVCEDCGQELLVSEQKLSFEIFQKKFGQKKTEKSCVKHNPDFKPKGRADEVPHQ